MSKVDTDSNAAIEKVLRELDEEEGQELKATTPTFVTDPLAANVYREREREYRDTEKHWVRRNGWLKFATEIASLKVGSKQLRYLTLPGYYRLDVALLLKNDLLEVTSSDLNGNADEVYVAALEADLAKFGRMQGQSPRFKLLAPTTLEDVLLEAGNAYYQEVRALFPFDLINLDLTTSLTPRHEGPYSRTMAAIEEIITLQAGFGRVWGLFLTFRNVATDWESKAAEQLVSNLGRNIDAHPHVAEAFLNRYGISTAQMLQEREFPTCMSQATLKWIVDRCHQHKLSVSRSAAYAYRRYNEGLPSYEIYKHCFIISKGVIGGAIIPTKSMPTQTWMVDELVKCIKTHRVVDVEERLAALYDAAPQKAEEIELEIKALCDLII